MLWEKELENLLAGIQWPETSACVKGVTSVLALIGRNEDIPRLDIVLMKRSMSVNTHKGQVSFPGGYHESTDADLLHTALREAQEEIGVKPSDVSVLGKLTPVETRGQVVIYPWLATIPLPYPFLLDNREALRLLFLPVSRVVTEGFSMYTIKIEGINVKSRGMLVDGELVWGATARILNELRDYFLQVDLTWR